MKSDFDYKLGSTFPVLPCLLVLCLLLIIVLSVSLYYYKRKLCGTQEYLIRYITYCLELKKQIPTSELPYRFDPPDITCEEFTKIIDNMLKRIMFLPLFVLPALLTGCAKDDPYNTPHPDKGAVKITTDWSGRSSDAILPDSYILRIGTQEQTVNGETNAFDALFLPGGQDLLVYHQAEGITVAGETATVNTLGDGTLEPMPGFLFSAAEELEIVADDTLQASVKMKQHIRTLVLVLKLNPGDDERIASTAATLTGIASAIRLTDGAITATEGKTTVPAFVLGTDGSGTTRNAPAPAQLGAAPTRLDAAPTRAAGQPVLSAALRLMGVMTGEKQVLTLAVTLTDGTVQTLTTDLTEMLKNFGTGADMKPLALDATLELPAEAGFAGTISEWNVVDNGQIEIH